MRRRWLFGFVLTLVLVLVPAGAALAQPPNDDIADATAVTAVPFADSVDATGATVEDGEPTFTCAPLHATVWYALTLDRNMTVTVDTAGSDYDTVLSVYRGGPDFADLDLVACNDDVTDLQARVSFAAPAGETLFVQVGAYGEEEWGEGAGRLEISFTRGTRRPTTFRDSFRGNHAFAEWFDEDGTTFSETFVSVSDGRSKHGRGRPIAESTLAVFSFEEEFDPATGSGVFTEFFGFLPLEPHQFAIDRQLRSAFVDASLTLEGVRCEFSDDSELDNGDDENDFEECEWFTADVDVSVTWTGQGGLQRFMFHEREHGDNFRFSFRSRGTHRDAVATGTVSGDVDLADGRADFAGLARTADAFMVWLR